MIFYIRQRIYFFLQTAKKYFLFYKVLQQHLIKKPMLWLVIFSACSGQDDRIADRVSRFRQLNGDTRIRTHNEGRYEVGRYISSDYEGELCRSLKEEEYESCQNKCRKMYDEESEKCERLPVDLIDSLNNLFEQMSIIQRIRDGEDALNNRVDEYNFGIMIEVSVEPVLELIRQWNNRETAEFLIWAAENPYITAAIQKYDEDHKILLRAFGKVVPYTNSADIIKYGLAKDLKGFGKTFLVLAEAVKNNPAFALSHNVIHSFCKTDKNCKLQYYCVNIRNERSPDLRNQCPYFRSSKVSFRNSQYCYIHGPDVWNYWKYLYDEGEIVDNTLDKTFVINEKVCDNVCKVNIRLCDRGNN